MGGTSSDTDGALKLAQLEIAKADIKIRTLDEALKAVL